MRVAPTPPHLPAELTSGPVVIKAWAPWCSSCRALAPLVERSATSSGVRVVELQVDNDPDRLTEAFAIRSVPTLIGLHNGTEVARLTGAQPADTVDSLFATTQSGAGSVRSQTPTSLIMARGAAGLLLVAAGFALSTAPLMVVGAALMAWAFGGIVQRAA